MNRKMSILAVLVMLVAITTYSVSGTYAKYTSNVALSSTAEIASWGFTVNGEDDKSETKTIDLFATVLDTKTGSAETDVKDKTITNEDSSTTTVKQIAPGTKGTFDLVVENTGDVTSTYDVKIEPVAENVKLPFTFATTTDLTEEVAAGETRTITYTWEWPYEVTKDGTTTEGDTADLALAGETISYNVTVTGTQVD